MKLSKIAYLSITNSQLSWMQITHNLVWPYKWWMELCMNHTSCSSCHTAGAPGQDQLCKWLCHRQETAVVGNVTDAYVMDEHFVSAGGLNWFAERNNTFSSSDVLKKLIILKIPISKLNVSNHMTLKDSEDVRCHHIMLA